MDTRFFSTFLWANVKKIFVLPLLFVLCSCASEPTSYYMLASNTLSPQVEFTNLDKKKMPKILLQEVRIPDYLDRNSITLRDVDGVRLIITDFHAWGEDLESGVERVLRSELLSSLLKEKVLLLPLDDDKSDAMKLFVFLNRFDGRLQDKVIIDACWTLRSYDNREVASGSFVDEVLVGADIASVVVAQSELIVKLAEHITVPIAKASHKAKK